MTIGSARGAKLRAPSRENPVMLAVSLGPDISFCVIDGAAVLLDIRRDRYFGLSHRVNDAFNRLCATGAIDRGALAGLFSSGVLVEGDGGAPLAATPDRMVANSLPHQPPPRSTWRALPAIALQVIAVRRRLRRGELGLLIDAMRRRRAAETGDDPDPSALAARIAIFQALRPFVPVTPSCLLDSLALLGWLGRLGRGVDLVFGVRRDPFAAHCWLQADDVVINDAVDTVAAFRPILIL